jgi:Double zinc ribbon
MKCSRCQHDNRAGARFCEQCAAPLSQTCGHCGGHLPPAAKFCPECAHPTGLASTAPTTPRLASPERHTPKHLAERILNSKAAIEGERKQVTLPPHPGLAHRPLVAHCHLGLGKLYRRTGKREEAREHLTTATTMYREIDMAFWLEQAEAEMSAVA